MAYRVDGLRRRIVAALGLSPLALGVTASGGCVSRTIDETELEDGSGDGGSSTSGTLPPVTMTTVSTTTPSSTVTTVDPGTDDGPIQACWPSGDYREWEMFYPRNAQGDCYCDEPCQNQALAQWNEENCCDSCWYVFGDVVCAEVWGDDACHYIVEMWEDGCGEGRPLRIDGHARTAPAQPREDWLADADALASGPGMAPRVSEVLAVPLPTGLSRDGRARLAEHWTRAALAEHASVASFARFVLDLTALGAPPSLLAEATTAMHDEIRHARLSFALATRYGDRPVGPGPLAMDGLHAGGEAEAIVRAAVREGCVDETLAAAEAELAAHRATDPAVRAVLAAVAEDESRHAVLAWRFVDWAVRRDPALATAVRDELHRATEDALARDRSNPADALDSADASAHGVNPPEMRRALRARCVHDTIRRCAAAMLHGVGARDDARA